MQLKLGKERVLVISDLQIPFHHPDSFEFLRECKRQLSPTRIVCIGDSLDCHALSKYISNPDGYSAGHEHAVALEFLASFWEIFPEGVEVQSNHNQRAWKRAFEAGIPAAFMKDYASAVGAPKAWSYVPSVEIDSVIYEHGDAFQGQYAAKFAVMANMKSTVIGHHHSFGSIHWISTKDQMLFGMNVGCLVDLSAYAFEYAKAYRFKPTLMAGFVDRGVPKLLPFVLNKRSRWSGELII